MKAKQNIPSKIFFYTLLVGIGFAKWSHFEDKSLEKHFITMPHGFETSAAFLSTLLYYWAISFSISLFLYMFFKIAFGVLKKKKGINMLSKKQPMRKKFLTAFKNYLKAKKDRTAYVFKQVKNIHTLKTHTNKVDLINFYLTVFIAVFATLMFLLTAPAFSFMPLFLFLYFYKII